jgi:hypothetical protein
VAGWVSPVRHRPHPQTTTGIGSNRWRGDLSIVLGHDNERRLG